MTENIKTTISASNTFFDLDGNIVPAGNYYFNINLNDIYYENERLYQ